MTMEKLQQELKKQLSLPFPILDWQTKLVQKILEGSDILYLAGTGRGKSLVWEAAAAMLKPKGKLVVVIEPLKSIEEDMVSSLDLTCTSFRSNLTYNRKFQHLKRS